MHGGAVARMHARSCVLHRCHMRVLSLRVGVFGVGRAVQQCMRICTPQLLRGVGREGFTCNQSIAGPYRL